jgi:hypothetical protein
LMAHGGDCRVGEARRTHSGEMDGDRPGNWRRGSPRPGWTTLARNATSSRAHRHLGYDYLVSNAPPIRHEYADGEISHVRQHDRAALPPRTLLREPGNALQGRGCAPTSDMQHQHPGPPVAMCTRMGYCSGARRHRDNTRLSMDDRGLAMATVPVRSASSPSIPFRILLDIENMRHQTPGAKAGRARGVE